MTLRRIAGAILGRPGRGRVRRGRLRIPPLARPGQAGSSRRRPPCRARPWPAVRRRLPGPPDGPRGTPPRLPASLQRWG